MSHESVAGSRDQSAVPLQSQVPPGVHRPRPEQRAPPGEGHPALGEAEGLPVGGGIVGSGIGVDEAEEDGCGEADGVTEETGLAEGLGSFPPPFPLPFPPQLAEAALRTETPTGSVSTLSLNLYDVAASRPVTVVFLAAPVYTTVVYVPDEPPLLRSSVYTIGLPVGLYP